MSAYFSTRSTVDSSSASVTTLSPNLSRTSARIFNASSPRPANAYGEVRGLNAPPRKNCAPLRCTASATEKACSRLSIGHGPQIARSQLVGLSHADSLRHARQILEMTNVHRALIAGHAYGRAGGTRH